MNDTYVYLVSNPCVMALAVAQLLDICNLHTMYIHRLICKHLNFDHHVVLPVYKAHPKLLIFPVMKKSVPYIRENTVHVLI